ncbi:putative alpha/beta superfamily hydrolase [Flavobacteriaceae bacterium MAR_2010_105]|nr:putative alpha/beta superfamily hydrolase [Flavobacteriaceae bacterium MAR_2010_105]
MRIVVVILWIITSVSFQTDKEKIVVKKVENAELYEGNLFRIDSFPTHFIKTRPVDIWLPKNYSKDKKYAVLYMHDGQSLFDSTTTWNKQEWKVDEWAYKLMNSGLVKDFIVVGIHNIPAIRWLDLFPQKAIDYLDPKEKERLFEDAKTRNISTDFKGDNYLKFLVKELKPFIDSTYSTLPDQKNTFIAGSSMGGLMSVYALSEYPDIFGGAACLSTHWVGAMPRPDNPFPDAIFDYLEANLPQSNSHKLYFDYGNKTLDENYPEYAPRVDEILLAKGYSNENFKNLMFEGTDHSENSWNKRFDIPLTFLLGIKN